ncbi:hypothetical protein Bca4012_003841 [Brassica carinata]
MYQKTIIFLTILLTSLRSCSSSYPFDPRYDHSISPNAYYETSHLHGHITHNRHMKDRHAHAPRSSDRAFNVNSFGAKANGNDDSQIYGKIEAWKNPSDYRERRFWIVFQTVDNLRVEGGGRIDGNGKIWWPKSCKINPELAVTFVECNNLMVRNIRLENAQQMHMRVQNCENVKALNLMVTSPGDSPNTDGIHVTGTRNILIQDSIIRTGDDCISIVSGSENVRATGITCGPGHGISIGSLGAHNSEAYVSNVVVSKATLIGTTNGVRIKTWQGGHGMAKNIIFQDILMKNVTNPIIINQDYCDQTKACPEQVCTE